MEDPKKKKKIEDKPHRQSGGTEKRNERNADRTTIEDEKSDAYGANDGQPPLDEAPVKTGGNHQE